MLDEKMWDPVSHRISFARINAAVWKGDRQNRTVVPSNAVDIE